MTVYNSKNEAKMCGKVSTAFAHTFSIKTPITPY